MGATGLIDCDATELARFNPRARDGRDGRFAQRVSHHMVVSTHAPVMGATALT